MTALHPLLKQTKEPTPAATSTHCSPTSSKLPSDMRSPSSASHSPPSTSQTPPSRGPSTPSLTSYFSPSALRPPSSAFSSGSPRAYPAGSTSRGCRRRARALQLVVAGCASRGIHRQIQGLRLEEVVVGAGQKEVA
eukprot:CAMPEP_0184735946 /NCGR_PEP_ID=MMETSP0314-20130426/62154_1 /TAXON_ID=38298 /ORGANISM="Rhodella maculata, Strain CCMP 736" /LENGTH=135 /DNA_ID=CAMNT_0027203003 /DNA_START=142 /DNA_END=549 /DNA_ORIENTATION=-